MTLLLTPFSAAGQKVCSPLLPGLLLRGFHGTLQAALEGLKLVQCFLQQKASHKLLQIRSFLIVLKMVLKKKKRGKDLPTMLEICEGRFRLNSERKQLGCFGAYTCKPHKQPLRFWTKRPLNFQV